MRSFVCQAGMTTALALLPLAMAQAAQVDLLVTYDDYSNTYFNGDVQAAMQNWVEQINTIYANSQVDVQLRLVGVMNHNDPGTEMGDVLGRVRTDSAVAQKRAELGADYVSQLHKSGYCGIGYLAIHPDWAFSVVGPDCGAQAMAHELGHTMGLHHSRRQGNTSGVRYDYALGYGVDGVFATVMAYGSAFGAPSVPKFSNPRITCNGLPCGVEAGQPEQADAALAINNVRDEIAGFLPTKVTQATPATGALANGTYSIKAKHSGKCLDVSGASTADGAALIQWTCHQANNQRWVLTALGDGYYEVKSKHSGKCMDVTGASTANGARLQQLACSRGNQQQWLIEAESDGNYRMTARHSGKVADVLGVSLNNGAAFTQWNWLNGNNQQFTFTRLE
ncbi:RICIN domain-containing protein [Pseudomonas sp. PIC25]|uniref:RICIN domain-containing protein n=1 Tax=Pseudomonas sp. PIC25 TaxID=1958773 RepID=UPI001C45100B|nr:RICIN domain-containing protein [Pseudomonas sp. PIC25]